MASPLVLLIVRTDVLLLAQLTVLFCAPVTTTVNCCVPPIVSDTGPGDTPTCTDTFTAIDAFFVGDAAEVAVSVALPTPIPVASPPVVTATTLAALVVQVTSWDAAPVTVAASCSEAPRSSAAGAPVMLTVTGATTVTCTSTYAVVPSVSSRSVARTVVAPTAIPVTTPWLDTAATAGFALDHRRFTVPHSPVFDPVAETVAVPNTSMVTDGPAVTVSTHGGTGSQHVAPSEQLPSSAPAVTTAATLNVRRLPPHSNASRSLGARLVVTAFME